MCFKLTETENVLARPIFDRRWNYHAERIACLPSTSTIRGRTFGTVFPFTLEDLIGHTFGCLPAPTVQVFQTRAESLPHRQVVSLVTSTGEATWCMHCQAAVSPRGRYCPRRRIRCDRFLGNARTQGSYKGRTCSWGIRRCYRPFLPAMTL